MLQETCESEQNGSVNDLYACNRRGIGNDDARHPDESTPYSRMLSDQYKLPTGNVATHYVKFSDSRPGPPRADQPLSLSPRLNKDRQIGDDISRNKRELKRCDEN